MNTTDKICCCTGHRPKGFIWNYYNKNNDAPSFPVCYMHLSLRTLVTRTADTSAVEGYLHQSKNTPERRVLFW